MLPTAKPPTFVLDIYRILDFTRTGSLSSPFTRLMDFLDSRFCGPFKLTNLDYAINI
jgi:hypothetical protein